MVKRLLNVISTILKLSKAIIIALKKASMQYKDDTMAFVFCIKSMQYSKVTGWTFHN
jgi:hypothetical protein